MLDGRHCWAVDVDRRRRGAARRRRRPVPVVVVGRRDDVGARGPSRAARGVAAQPPVLRPVRHRHRRGARRACARRCPDCGLLAYPRLAPAVIMLVERDDGRALLARNANFPSGMFSCLAGFVEPGETLEHAVRREVMEEVGLAIGDVEFRGSQPWPFPHQVMIGFGAQYLSRRDRDRRQGDRRGAVVHAATTRRTSPPAACRSQAGSSTSGARAPADGADGQRGRTAPGGRSRPCRPRTCWRPCRRGGDAPTTPPT